MVKPLVIRVDEALQGGASHVYVFEGGPVVVGRDPGADLIIDRDVISGAHGVFDIESGDIVRYSDLGSRNGTLLEGHRLATDEPVAVREHEILSIGYLRLQVLAKPPERPPGPEVRDPFAPGNADRRGIPKETEVLSPEASLAGAMASHSAKADRPANPPFESSRLRHTGTAPPGENEAAGAAPGAQRAPSLGRPGGPRLVPAQRLQPGELFQPDAIIGAGKYNIRGLIGAGGMSAVYRAYDFRFKSDVAIKVLAPELAARADLVERFEREAQLARQIASPHVVVIYDVDIENGLPYFVMELLVGEPLGKLIEREPLSLGRAAGILLDVLNGVIAAHDLGIVHRDLKPDNIFLVGSGRRTLAKVVDFGISKSRDSKLTEHGAVMGTAYYWSPEQITNSAAIDPRSDQFALAAIFYECLTQRPPHAGTNLYMIAQNIVNGRFESLRRLRPDIPEEVDAIVRRALSVDPADRYPSTRDLGEALRPYAPRDAQAMFLRLSSDSVLRQPSGPIETEDRPPSDALPVDPRPGGTRLLPEGGLASRQQLSRTAVLPPTDGMATNSVQRPSSRRRAVVGEKVPGGVPVHRPSRLRWAGLAGVVALALVAGVWFTAGRGARRTPSATDPVLEPAPRSLAKPSPRPAPMPAAARETVPSPSPDDAPGTPQSPPRQATTALVEPATKRRPPPATRKIPKHSGEPVQQPHKVDGIWSLPRPSPETRP
jgi:serine/threonine protein kinase